jgi:hypothetical protein
MNEETKMNEETLFNLDAVAMDSPRLADIKAADIQTHYAPEMDEDPWIAVPMMAARKMLKGYIDHDSEAATVPDISINFYRHLDDAGMIFYGDTEREVQDAALDWLATR